MTDFGEFFDDMGMRRPVAEHGIDGVTEVGRETGDFAVARGKGGFRLGMERALCAAQVRRLRLIFKATVMIIMFNILLMYPYIKVRISRYIRKELEWGLVKCLPLPDVDTFIVSLPLTANDELDDLDLRTFD